MCRYRIASFWLHKAQQQEEQKHLYLVIDDRERGYSIYGVDTSIDSEPCLDAHHVECLVPIRSHGGQAPALLVFRRPRHQNLGDKAQQIQPRHPRVRHTETLGASVCPYPRSRGDIGGRPVYASVGDKLLAFYNSFVEVLGPEPASSSDDQRRETEESWSWTNIGRPPFTSVKVSYAVHPDGRTIFVSVHNYRPYGYLDDKIRDSTFSFDMEDLEWTYVGEWILPFKGRAYYDRELDAWVGLCLHKEGAVRVCSCDVTPVSGCETMPAWKLGRDVFFDTMESRSESEIHMGATLVYKGDSRFCLLESRMPTDGDPSKRVRLVKMTSFALKYDKDGDLRHTHQRAHASVSYQIAHKRIDRNDKPVAFWM